ncbi:MAG: AAA family ATPase [Chloroflexi bacterium]|nr:AAA family ATPase [Chloroflexota bacterium]
MTDDELFEYAGARWKQLRRRWYVRYWKRIVFLTLFVLFLGPATMQGLGQASVGLAGAWQENPGSVIIQIGMLAFQLAFAILFMIIQFVAIFWFLGRPRVYWVMPGETGVGFKDYKGNPEVLESASRVVRLLHEVKRFKMAGGVPVRGLLLVGPPGTGKSYLAQAISTEAGVPFGYLSAPSIQGMFWGMDVLRVWSLYRKARKLAGEYGACILFIDEIDAIGASRMRQGQGMGLGGMMMGGGSGALNQLLNEMDPLPRDDSWRAKLLRSLGMKKGKAEIPVVLTMGATNAPDALDLALLRPGRFDRKVTVDLPSADGRREILEYYLSKVNHDPNLPLDKMVHDTISYTPVAIKHVVNEALIVAHFDGRDVLTYDDFSRARETHEFGLAQPIPTMTAEDRRRLAYHEAGHAFAMFVLLERLRVSHVTIVRHGTALGFAAPKPKEEIHTMTREELLAEIQVTLASRAAEQLFLGTELSGVVSDLQQATHAALGYMGVYGMGGTFLSAITLNGPTPEMKKAADRLLNEQFALVKATMEQHRDAVAALAEGLLQHSDLTGDQVLEICSQSGLAAGMYARRLASKVTIEAESAREQKKREEEEEQPRALPVPAATGGDQPGGGDGSTGWGDEARLHLGVASATLVPDR